MSCEDQHILSSYENLGLSIAQIAEETGYDEVAIKTILMQKSVLYRKEHKKNPTEVGFKEHEAEEVRDIIMNIARYEEDDQTLKFKAARFIYDDYKGRNDLVKAVQGININVLNFNDQMQKALAARERTIKATVTDVPVVEQEKQLTH